MFTEQHIHNKVLDHGVVMWPEHSLKSMNTNIFEDLPLEQVYHDLNMDTMNTITKQVYVLSNNDEIHVLF